VQRLFAAERFDQDLFGNAEQIGIFDHSARQFDGHDFQDFEASATHAAGAMS
jgi:hypothetical protein